jgi:hypothetical protein
MPPTFATLDPVEAVVTCSILDQVEVMFYLPVVVESGE